MLRLGVTGSRHGATSAQLRTMRQIVRDLVQEHGRVELHHGDCLGVDAEMHSIVRAAGGLCIGHPPLESHARAYCINDRDEPAAPYMTRNQAIVDACEVLVAVPSSDHEVLRSGTWSTVRRARARGRRVLLVLRSGQVVEEGMVNTR